MPWEAAAAWNTAQWCGRELSETMMRREDYNLARMSGMLDLSRDEKATMSDGPDGDYGYVLCERPCAFGKA